MRETLEGEGMAGLGDLLSLRKRWNEVVGEEASRKTRPYRLEKGKLYVGVESHVWAQEMHFMTATTKARVKELLGVELEDVVVKRINM
jgi:predicted nucleic acid-binding Zn ribbon protein